MYYLCRLIRKKAKKVAMLLSVTEVTRLTVIN